MPKARADGVWLCVLSYLSWDFLIIFRRLFFRLLTWSHGYLWSFFKYKISINQYISIQYLMAIPITPHTPLLLGRRQPPSPLIPTHQPLTPLHWQHRCRVVSGSASNLHLPFSPESSAPNSKCRQPTYSKHDIELHVHSKARADVIWFNKQ